MHLARKLILRSLGGIGTTFVIEVTQTDDMCAHNGRSLPVKTLLGTSVFENITSCNLCTLLSDQGISTDLVRFLGDNKKIVFYLRWLPVFFSFCPDAGDIYCAWYPMIRGKVYREGVAKLNLTTGRVSFDGTRIESTMPVRPNRHGNANTSDDCTPPSVHTSIYRGNDLPELVREASILALKIGHILNGVFAKQSYVLQGGTLKFGIAPNGALCLGGSVSLDNLNIRGPDGRDLGLETLLQTSASLREITDAYMKVAQISSLL